MENENMNIPTMSVSDAVEQLSALYVNAIKVKMPFKALPTPFLWGAAGVGKSDGVKQLADKLSKETGKTVKVTDVRLLLYSPIDLRGVPVADEHRKFTNWLRPNVFNMDDSKDVVNILFLDELSAAPQSVQAAAYQICLDRTVGEHKLPDNCIVIAAGNRTTDQSIAYKMPKALCNRLMHFKIQTDFESWKIWAIQNGTDSRIVGYLSFNNSKLCVEPESSDMAYPTPRSWNFVDTLLKTINSNPFAIHSVISGCIGTDTAIEFEEWCKNNADFPDVGKIISGKCQLYPKDQDILYALISSLVAAIRQKAETISVNELENVCSYARLFPTDFAFSFFRDINSIDTLKLKLMKCKSLQAWLSQNKRYL